MKPEGSNTPRFYRLPKVHELEVPLRPIASLRSILTYRLAKKLQRRLKHLVDGSNHSIHSAQEFLNIIKDTRIDEEKINVSFNVTALFTSINIPLAKETLASLLDRPGIQTPNNINTISKDGTFKLLDLCLTTHFTFDDKVHGQITTTLMGSLKSGLIAEAIMQRLERTTLPTVKLKLWIRYVGDTIVIIKAKLEETRLLINNVLTGIKFIRGQQQQTSLPGPSDETTHSDWASMRRCGPSTAAELYSNTICNLMVRHIAHSTITIKPGDQPSSDEECRRACQEQHQAYLMMRCRPGEATKQDYLHAKQRKQQVID
eukprot:g47495.t1